MRFYSAIALLALYAGSCEAFTGGDFVSKCGSLNSAPAQKNAQGAIDHALDAGSCTGFVGGVVKGVNLIGGMLQAQGAAKHNFICLPEGLHAVELVNQSVAYIKATPDAQKLPAQAGIYSAMMRKYACKP